MKKADEVVGGPDSFVCGSPEAMRALGRRIGAGLHGGEAVLIEGPLGAGKTLLTKGILETLGFDPANVNSPSFTLVNRYDARLTVFHIDLWRIDSRADAAFAVGLDELVEVEGAVIIVEWAENLGGYDFPGDVIRLRLRGDGAGSRSVAVKRSRI